MVAVEPLADQQHASGAFGIWEVPLGWASADMLHATGQSHRDQMSGWVQFCEKVSSRFF